MRDEEVKRVAPDVPQSQPELAWFDDFLARHHVESAEAEAVSERIRAHTTVTAAEILSLTWKKGVVGGKNTCIAPQHR